MVKKLNLLQKFWWRWRESNPRPKIFHTDIYILSLNFIFCFLNLLQTGYFKSYSEKISLFLSWKNKTSYPAYRRSYRICRNNPTERQCLSSYCVIIIICDYIYVPIVYRADRSSVCSQSFFIPVETISPPLFFFMNSILLF